MANLSNINNKFIVTDGGNVLIGATADVATVRLQVKNASAAAVLRLTGGSDSWDFDTYYTDNKLFIKSSGAAGTVMTLLGASGNVGIGTDSPQRKLDVKSNSDTAPSAYLRGGKSSQGEIQNTGLIIGTQTDMAAGDYQGISFTGYTSVNAIARGRAAIGVKAINGPGKMDLVFMAKHQDDGTQLLSDDIKMVIKGSLTSNKQSRVGIGYDFAASKIHEPEGTNALDVYGTGFFGYQDFRDHDTYPPQKVLVLRGAPASGAYAQSRFNWYTKSGTTSNGIAAIQIKSQYGTDGESGVLFHLGGSGNVGIGTTDPTSQLFVNNTADGDKIRWGRSDALVGSVGTYNGVPYIGYQGGAGGGIMFNGSSIEPTALGSTRSSSTNDIGSANYLWRNIYLSGGAYLGGTATANKLSKFVGNQPGNGAQWTPTVTTSQLTNPTITSSSGYYQQVGNVVTASFEFTMSNPTVGAGSVIINNLPIVFADNNHVSGCGVIGALGKTINVRYYTGSNQIAMNFYDGNYCGTTHRTVGTVTYWAAT